MRVWNVRILECRIWSHVTFGFFQFPARRRMDRIFWKIRSWGRRFWFFHDFFTWTFIFLIFWFSPRSYSITVIVWYLFLDCPMSHRLCVKINEKYCIFYLEKLSRPNPLFGGSSLVFGTLELFSVPSETIFSSFLRENT